MSNYKNSIKGCVSGKKMNTLNIHIKKISEELKNDFMEHV